MKLGDALCLQFGVSQSDQMMVGTGELVGHHIGFGLASLGAGTGYWLSNSFYFCVHMAIDTGAMLCGVIRGIVGRVLPFRIGADNFSAMSGREFIMTALAVKAGLCKRAGCGGGVDFRFGVDLPLPNQRARASWLLSPRYCSRSLQVEGEGGVAAGIFEFGDSMAEQTTRAFIQVMDLMLISGLQRLTLLFKKDDFPVL